jgi:hypothetical protein
MNDGCVTGTMAWWLKDTSPIGFAAAENNLYTEKKSNFNCVKPMFPYTPLCYRYPNTTAPTISDRSADLTGNNDAVTTWLLDISTMVTDLELTGFTAT